MSGTNANSSKGLDRKFIIAAIVIGLSYALIVAALGLLLGQSAAGVAGVALTALTTALFKKFEDLRFKKIATTTIEIATLGSWAVLLLAFSFIGWQFVIGLIVGLVATATAIQLDSIASLNDFAAYVLDPSVLVFLFLANFLAYFSAAYCAVRVMTQLRYSQVLIVGLLVLMCNQFFPILTTALHGTDAVKTMLSSPYFYAAGIFWIVYLAGALLGARLAVRHSGRLQDVDG